MSQFANLLSMLGLCRIDPGREEVTATAPLGDREFLVPNMVCEGCAEKIAETLTSIPGRARRQTEGAADMHPGTI